MSGMRVKRSWSALLLTALGCWTTEPSVKPPPRPDELLAPPTNELRYSTPPNYPKEALRDFTPKKKDDLNGPGAGPGGPRFGGGGGPGMGGP